MQSTNARTERLHEADGDEASAAAAGAAAKTRAVVGFTSVWRAAKGWGKEGWVLRQRASEKRLPGR